MTLTPSFAAGVKSGGAVAKDGTTLERVAGFSVGDTVLVQDGTHRAIVTVAQLTPGTGEVKWEPDLDDPRRLHGRRHRRSRRRTSTSP